MTIHMIIFLSALAGGFVGFFVGLFLGNLNKRFNFYRHTVWFIVDLQYEKTIADKLGHIKQLEISVFNDEQKTCFVTIRLFKWFDFQNNTAENYHRDLLQRLKSWGVPVHKSGVY